MDRTADLAVSALADDFRRSGGVGDLESLVRKASAAAHVAPTDAVNGSGDMRTRHQLTLAIASARSGDLSLASQSLAAETVVEKVVSNTVTDRVSRMLPTLIGPGKYSASELVDRIEALRGHAQMLEFCKRLIRNPQAKRLRAPNRIVKPLKARDLLNAELDSL
jgi:hypothetical protein